MEIIMNGRPSPSHPLVLKNRMSSYLFVIPDGHGLARQGMGGIFLLLFCKPSNSIPEGPSEVAVYSLTPHDVQLRNIFTEIQSSTPDSGDYIWGMDQTVESDPQGDRMLLPPFH